MGGKPVSGLPANELYEVQQSVGNHLSRQSQTHPEQMGTNRHSPCEGQIAAGRNVPKRDSSAGFRCAMPGIDRSEDILDGDIVEGDAPACVELVPVTPSARRSPNRSPARPDASFVAQLIATAEQAPQTRNLRRASLADAQTAYGARAQERRNVARRTRQVI